MIAHRSARALYSEPAGGAPITAPVILKVPRMRKTRASARKAVVT